MAYPNQIFACQKSAAKLERYAEKASRRVVNEKLYELGKSYHDGLPLAVIDGWLEDEGFGKVIDGIYCGNDGKILEQVGPHSWFAMTWHRMQSGRYEIVAYLS